MAMRMLALGFVCSWFCVHALAADQADSDETVFELGAGITPPAVIHQVPPNSSPGSRGIKIEGVVAIELVVSSQGLPKNLRVVRSLDKDVDRSALDAVKEWRFSPARKDKKPVAVRITLEIRFHDM